MSDLNVKGTPAKFCADLLPTPDYQQRGWIRKIQWPDVIASRRCIGKYIDNNHSPGS
ncbi:hypothetical protein IG631_22046 [Alternaria alternata]|nr:hypothetical protein IG631_22046 [Alternaria alternata]